MQNQTIRSDHSSQNFPCFTVESFNTIMGIYLADPSRQVDIKKDWRAFIAYNFTLTENQASFFNNLPFRSIIAIQKAITSVIESGGTIYLEKVEELDAIEVVCDGILIFKPRLKIVICRFDKFFKNCKWFPKDQKHEDRPGDL